jgi:hypothetical protein
MIIPIVVFVAAYLVSAYVLKWHGDDNERLSFKDSIVVALVPAFFIALFLGGGGWAAAYQWQQDPVEVNYTIYPDSNGNYVNTSGGRTMWYYKDGIALKEAWKDSSYVDVAYMPEGTRAHVEGMCDSSETVPQWLLLPWEKGEDHVFHRECSYEEFEVFVPMGES